MTATTHPPSTAAVTGTTHSARLAEAPGDFEMIRTEVRRLCNKYGNEYWRGLEPVAQKCLGLPKSY